MRTVYLHIGSPRTGSTSLQAFLRWNRQALIGQGVLYPYATGETESRHLVTGAALVPPDLEKVYFPYLDPEPCRSWVADNLAAEVATFATRAVVLSDERLMSRLSTVEEVARVRDTLAPHGEVKVICYLRPQDDALFSGWGYEMRRGNALWINELPSATKMLGWFDYAQTLERWRTVFGPDAMLVRRYDPAKDSALIEDVAGLAGIDLTGLRLPGRLNWSSSGPGFAWSRQFAAALSSRLTGSAVHAMPLSSRTLAARREEIMARFEESNRSVAETYLGGGPLFPKAAEREDPEYVLTVEQCMEFAADYFEARGLRASDKRRAEALFGEFKASIQAHNYKAAADVGSELLDVPRIGLAFPLDALRYRIAGCLLKCGSLLGATAMLAGIARMPDSTMAMHAQATELLFQRCEPRFALEAFQRLKNRNLPTARLDRLQQLAITNTPERKLS